MMGLSARSKPRPLTEGLWTTYSGFSSGTYDQNETSQSLKRFFLASGFQFSSVTQSCLTLCNPMNRSTPGLPVHHQLPEFTQTHVHQVRDAIQPSHPLASPSPPAPIPPSIRVFSNESTLHMRWPKYWSLSLSISPSNEYPSLSCSIISVNKVSYF